MSTKPWGVLAQYENPADVFHACETVRDAGYSQWDACTPFPVHGLDKAMGLKPSVLPWAVLIIGISGSAFMLWFESWTSGNLYPFIVGGKPLFSVPAFVPVWYEMTVLSSCLTAFFGNWIINGLPRPHHPAFASKAFERVTDDKFFIMVESTDPKFDLEKTKALLADAGATLVEELEA
jgi:Protein of unknown function (DUF3341)